MARTPSEGAKCFHRREPLCDIDTMLGLNLSPQGETGAAGQRGKVRVSGIGGVGVGALQGELQRHGWGWHSWLQAGKQGPNGL